jgi:hypothetical protein
MNSRERQFFGAQNEKEELSDSEVRWGALHDRYAFSHCDEFDLLLIEGVKKGFFSESALKNGIETYLTDAKRARARAAIEAAWEPFHASFKSDAATVAQSIFDGCAQNVSGANFRAMGLVR